jgi:hypothetical protein
MIRLDSAIVAMVKEIIGKPHYSITLTLRPVHGARRLATKQVDAEQAFAWFLHFLNTRCFGHGHRRNGYELGVFAALEGLGKQEQPHWHTAFRLPTFLSHARFLNAFELARKRTRRLGYEFDLQPFYEGCWINYSLKTGPDSFYPKFLRAGTQ